MTVTYTAQVATCRKFGCFIPLLARWRASIYKLIWMDLVVYLLLYYMLTILYVYILAPDQKRIFESIVEYCIWHGNIIPVSFVLGFYVSIVMKRWWNQYLCIPWPDAIAVYVAAHVRGTDERPRVIRRTIMRYVCLSLAIALARMSPRVKKRFPTWDHFVTAGLLQESEKQIIAALDQKFKPYPKHWMPLVWAASIIARARKEGLIRDDCAVNTIVTGLNSFRGSCGSLMHHDFISIPLVYTQVVTLAVYTYFLSSLMSKQPIESTASFTNNNPYYFPVFSTLEFFFYMGWLKVAETLINPFGEDDDDFEVNWLIDRHLLVSYLIVDEMHEEHPELVRDQYWDQIFPDLPYADTGAKREDPPEPSTAKIMLQPSVARIDATSVHRSIGRVSKTTRIESDSQTDSQENLQLNLGGLKSYLSFSPSILKPWKSVIRSEHELNSAPRELSRSGSDTSTDYFERLKAERESERHQRLLKAQNSLYSKATQITEKPQNLQEGEEEEEEEGSLSANGTERQQRRVMKASPPKASHITKKDGHKRLHRRVRKAPPSEAAQITEESNDRLLQRQLTQEEEDEEEFLSVKSDDS